MDVDATSVKCSLLDNRDKLPKRKMVKNIKVEGESGLHYMASITVNPNKILEIFVGV